MVNQQFTFAVHILTVLAFSPGEVIGSQILAASVNTNPVVVRRLLLALRRARLIETFTGKHGGARLRKKPREISLMDVYDAVEPRPVIPVNERKAFRRCHVSCNMKSIMSRVAGSTEDAVRNHLRSITLGELVRGLHSRR
ncbi:MAG TPA: Rrf2 family transcriptional regulator [Chthoniobacterales bacterium]|nr:Rrf2 family transcriptional regulator [Chthoniobacterales bacterium]